jgi:hypothetical protein
MLYKRETPDAEVIVDILKHNGMSVRQLSKLMYGEKTHRDVIKDLRAKPDIRSSTLVRICNLLEISMEILFKYDTSIDNNVDVPSIVGNNNVINSSVVNNDITSLRAENKALKLLLEEKNLRIEDLREHNKELISHLNMLMDKTGHIKDTKK